jgi:hypothetical protein
VGTSAASGFHLKVIGKGDSQVHGGHIVKQAADRAVAILST